MMEMGVHAFLLKNTEPDELEKAIYSVMEKDFYHNDLVANVLRKNVLDEQNSHGCLTDGELRRDPHKSTFRSVKVEERLAGVVVVVVVRVVDLDQFFDPFSSVVQLIRSDLHCFSLRGQKLIK